MAGTILLGIDVETADGSGTYARLGPEFLARLGIRASWYVTGRAMEASPDLFRAADRTGQVDIQGHTYSHILLKTVFIEVPPGRTVNGRTDFFLKRGGTIEEIDADLGRAQKVFHDVLGRRAAGLTCPWGYYRGLADRPDLLEIVHRHGFRFIRSFGRDERDGQPVPLERRPFRYGPQGFPDMLELVIHDYQDDFYFAQFTGLTDPAAYTSHLREVADRVAREDLVWSLCTHDHGCATDAAFAVKTAWVSDLIAYAKSRGIRFATGAEYYAGM